MRANQLERCARPRSGDNQPSGGVPKGISVLVPLGCDAKAGGLLGRTRRDHPRGETTAPGTREVPGSARPGRASGRRNRASPSTPGRPRHRRARPPAGRADGWSRPSCSSSKPLPCQLYEPKVNALTASAQLRPGCGRHDGHAAGLVARVPSRQRQRDRARQSPSQRRAGDLGR